MFANTLNRKALAILVSLMHEPLLHEYRLVGGSALALLSGHRISVDLDLFMVGRANAAGLIALLENNYDATQISIGDEQAIVTSMIDTVKVDFVAYPYKWLYPFLSEEWPKIYGELCGEFGKRIKESKIRIADPRDIAAMKIAAIGQRGKKKDFFDLAQLLSNFSLKELFEFFRLKYPKASDFHYLQALAFFDDAERDPDPEKTETTPSWESVKVTVAAAVRGFSQTIFA